MELFLLSFVAGILTVLAPCILPVLPVILSGSLSEQGSKWRPFIIVLSLGISIILFTLLLKVSSLFISVPPSFWTMVSAVIILLFGLTLVFPKGWDVLSFRLGLYKTEGLIDKAKGKQGILGDILLGAALGPVFSSCSPTYALILATILPQSLGLGTIHLVVYSVGLIIPLLLIAYGGRAVVKKMKMLANPNGMFKKIIGIILLIVGIAILTGFDKQIQNSLIDQGLGSTALERQLIEDTTKPLTNSGTTVQGSNLPILYPAPEFTGVDTWFNSSPLTMKELRGKVVLVDFWTFSCINCIRTLPYMKELNAKYKDQGLVIVGVHAPEFAFEKVPANVEASIKEKELTYPIVLDNNFKTWAAYHNQYWPAKYLIDKDGNVRYTHFGEGNYAETEEAIRELLRDAGKEVNENMDYSTGITEGTKQIGTPEIYIGAGRQDHFGGEDYSIGVTKEFKEPSSVKDNTFYLVGTWNIENEKATLVSDTGKIIINYNAPKANIVLGGESVPAEIKLDGKALNLHELGSDVELIDGKSTALIKEERLYNFSSVKTGTMKRTLEVEFKKSGIEAYAFTFG